MTTLASSPVPSADAATPQVKPIGISGPAVADLIGIPRTAFYAMRSAGKFGPEGRKLGRRVLFDRDEVVAWFKAGCPAAHVWRRQQQESQRGRGRG